MNKPHSNLLNNVKGFSLTQVLVAVGITGIIGVTVLQLMDQSTKMVSFMQKHSSSDVSQKLASIILEDPVLCKSSGLGGMVLPAAWNTGGNAELEVPELRINGQPYLRADESTELSRMFLSLQAPKGPATPGLTTLRPEDQIVIYSSTTADNVLRLNKYVVNLVLETKDRGNGPGAKKIYKSLPTTLIAVAPGNTAGAPAAGTVTDCYSKAFSDDGEHICRNILGGEYHAGANPPCLLNKVNIAQTIPGRDSIITNTDPIGASTANETGVLRVQKALRVGCDNPAVCRDTSISMKGWDVTPQGNKEFGLEIRARYTTAGVGYPGTEIRSIDGHGRLIVGAIDRSGFAPRIAFSGYQDPQHPGSVNLEFGSDKLATPDPRSFFSVRFNNNNSYHSLLLAKRNYLSLSPYGDDSTTPQRNVTYIGAGPSPSPTRTTSHLDVRVESSFTEKAYFDKGVRVTGSLETQDILAQSVSTTSDINLKDITRLRDNSDKAAALKKIARLKTYQYIYKNDKTKEERTGFVAQDILEIFPEFVTRNSQGELGVRYADFVVPLSESTQVLSRRIEELEKINRKQSEEIQSLRDDLKKAFKMIKGSREK